MKSLDTMTEEVYQNCVDKGWYEDERTFGDMIALGHSEFSEMLEAFRDHGTKDATVHTNFCEGMPCICTAKPEGIGSEAADVFIRLLDTCHRYGIDLDYEYERKMKYNRTRPHKHGGRAL